MRAACRRAAACRPCYPPSYRFAQWLGHVCTENLRHEWRTHVHRRLSIEIATPHDMHRALGQPARLESNLGPQGAGQRRITDVGAIFVSRPSSSTSGLADGVEYASVVVNGAQVGYFDVGSGLPIVLLHGSGPGATAWGNFEHNVGELSARFRVIGIDLPGWGRSPISPGEPSHSTTVVGVLDALSIDRAALVGNSLGAAVALAVAAARPERVVAVVTMGSVSGRTAVFAPSGPTEGLKALVGAYRNPAPDGMRRLVEVMTFSSEFADAGVIAARSQAALAHPEHLAGFLASLESGQFLRPLFSTEDLRRITAPVLLIHGRDDRVIGYEHSLQLLSDIPNSRALILNRCGHWAQLEHSHEFNQATVEFVELAMTKEVLPLELAWQSNPNEGE